MRLIDNLFVYPDYYFNYQKNSTVSKRSNQNKDLYFPLEMKIYFITEETLIEHIKHRFEGKINLYYKDLIEKTHNEKHQLYLNQQDYITFIFLWFKCVFPKASNKDFKNYLAIVKLNLKLLYIDQIDKYIDIDAARTFLDLDDDFEAKFLQDIDFNIDEEIKDILFNDIPFEYLLILNQLNLIGNEKVDQKLSKINREMFQFVLFNNIHQKTLYILPQIDEIYRELGWPELDVDYATPNGYERLLSDPFLRPILDNDFIRNPSRIKRFLPQNQYQKFIDFYKVITNRRYHEKDDESTALDYLIEHGFGLSGTIAGAKQKNNMLYHGYGFKHFEINRVLISIFIDLVKKQESQFDVTWIKGVSNDLLKRWG